MPLRKEHRIKKYSTVRVKGGYKVAVYCLSCVPCQVYGQEYPTKSARDKAAEEHSRG